MKLRGFGEQEREQRMAPTFNLQSGAGREVRLWDYKQRKPLVIYFVRGDEESFLRQLQGDYSAYTREGAEMLVIAAVSRESVAELTANLGLTYPLLADPDRKVLTRYIQLFESNYDPSAARTQPVAVFVADRFGSIYGYATSHEVSHLPPQQEILELLDFMGNLCNP